MHDKTNGVRPATTRISLAGIFLTLLGTGPVPVLFGKNRDILLKIGNFHRLVRCLF